MRTNAYMSLIALLLLVREASAQKVAFQFFVYNSQTEQPLRGASIEINKQHRATLTDGEGHAELLELNPGPIDRFQIYTSAR
ncbi:hypothetical protein GCM10028807_02820 [Spirosoma daeguense]